MVLHVADKNLVSGFQARSKAVGYHVDGLGGATGPDDFPRALSVQEIPDCLTGTLEGGRGAIAKGMSSPVHVGVHFAVIPIHGVQHGHWLLGRCTVVQIHQRLAVYLLGQDRKIPANRLHIKCGALGGACNGQIGHNRLRLLKCLFEEVVEPALDRLPHCFDRNLLYQLVDKGHGKQDVGLASADTP